MMTPERLKELRGYATENLAYIEAEATRLLPWQHRLAEAVAEIDRLQAENAMLRQRYGKRVPSALETLATELAEEEGR